MMEKRSSGSLLRMAEAEGGGSGWRLGGRYRSVGAEVPSVEGVEWEVAV